MTSFRMEFEKIGRGLLRQAFRSEGSALLAEREGRNKKESVQENADEHWSTLIK